MKTRKLLILASSLIMFVLYSCDSSYTLSYVINNTSQDTIHVSYSYFGITDTATTILPNERKVFLRDEIIRKASSFDDCCPCHFNFITTNDSTIQITNSGKWSVEKQNKDTRHKEGYVNCVFNN